MTLHLTMALGDYDQTRDLLTGVVPVPGIDLTVLNMSVEEIFFRFFDRLEWQVSELSMGMYSSAVSRGDRRFIAIPVFPSRVFRHAAFYIRDGGPVRKIEDLAGKRIGVPQWSQTATIYARGLLAETVGIPLSGIKWVQGGVNDPGRPEPAVLKLPEGIVIEEIKDRSLNDILLSGDLDAVISARPPRSYIAGDKRIRRLFDDSRSAEIEYFGATGIFPIMHTVALRRDAFEANPWIARNLYLAFEEAKNRSVARMFDLAASHTPIPWGAELARESASRIFGQGDPWPYGVEANRRTLEAFLRFAADQGTCHRRLAPEEIFAEEATAEIKV